ncbi:uncharacterized protein An02g01310 [Aspergillus niger]|uniref:Contig An02c0010, genomic contig n=2 Tax=Aspergillus niger TaxID=5061 RepID=A2QBV1_ASPNC|nr:uncharacterized protein An02g01310 [Aspergillus niger]CAK96348.1 unnamed protein product [Aspergillus niger]
MVYEPLKWMEYGELKATEGQTGSSPTGWAASLRVSATAWRSAYGRITIKRTWRLGSETIHDTAIYLALLGIVEHIPNQKHNGVRHVEAIDPVHSGGAEWGVMGALGMKSLPCCVQSDYASTAAMSIISQSEKDDASKYMMHAWQGSSRYNALRPESSATRRKRAICPNGREAKKN